MNTAIINTIQFPIFSGIKCTMMPFIQGDNSSLPEIYRPYAKIIQENFIDPGELGFLTIQESFVNVGMSQRGYNSTGASRSVHVEVGTIEGSTVEEVRCWGSGWGSSWGGRASTRLSDETMILIANSIADTCRVWDTKEMRYTKDGDLSAYIDEYPESSGLLLGAGEVAKISIFTPHECVNQNVSGNRQFFRVVGKEVTGRDTYFTINPLVKHKN